MHNPIAVSVSEFVTLLNQTLAYAYPAVTVTGEVAHFRVSKNRWVYFDLKDDDASLKCFGTVYQLPGPLEDGMVVAVQGVPRLHPLYGFSLTAQNIRPVGEGSIKKSAQLLQAKLTAEGLFDDDRKRALPYPPRHVGLIASAESAAYRDFVKVLAGRWGGVRITLIDVQVQGDAAAGQVVQAINQFNQMADGPDVLVVTRGGGSADDLQAFSTEQVTRAVAASRIPTMVAIGHEVDISLAELAADKRASTPSNAAELLVPDRTARMDQLRIHQTRLLHYASRTVDTARQQLALERDTLHGSVQQLMQLTYDQLRSQTRLLHAFDPQTVLQRGYALVRKGDMVVRQGQSVAADDIVSIELANAHLTAVVKRVIIRSNDTD